MGNVVGSFFSGFSQVIGKLLGHPLDFLAGKSCDMSFNMGFHLLYRKLLRRAVAEVGHGGNIVLLCYTTQFISGALPSFHVLSRNPKTLISHEGVPEFFVLLFFYLSYKLGICQCICHTLCRTTWACFATCFSTLDFCCTYLCFKLKSVKRTRRRRRRDLENELSSSTNEEDCEESFSFQQPKNFKDRRSMSHRRRNYKQEHLRKALRPNSHRANLGISRNSIHRQTRNTYGSDHISPVHHIHVTRSSKFAHHGSRHKGKVYHRRR